jgi:hypothetical protein
MFDLDLQYNLPLYLFKYIDIYDPSLGLKEAVQNHKIVRLVRVANSSGSGLRLPKGCLMPLVLAEVLNLPAAFFEVVRDVSEILPEDEWLGLMAQDVLKINQDAVTADERGFLMLDYAKALNGLKYIIAGRISIR